MPHRRALALAIAVSFCIYLIPVVGPHAMFFLGGTVFLARNAQWTAVNLAVAIALQLTVAALLYWVFRKPGWLRAAVPLIAFPFLVWAVELLYMVVIPTAFLEQADTAIENVAWPLECSAAGVSQTNLRTDTDLWVRYNPKPNTYAVFTMPGCALAPVELPQPVFHPGAGTDFMIEPISSIEGGIAVVQKYETKAARTSWWLAPGMQPLEAPAAHAGSVVAPILSTDGKWAAWLETIANSGPPVLQRIILHSRDPKQPERIVDLSGLGPATYVILKFDVQAEELRLWKNDHLIAINFDGTLKKEFPRPSSARPQSNTYHVIGNGWLAWDAYRDDGQYIVEWSLPGGTGLHRVLLGRTIHSVAADAAGRYIAISVGTGLNIGSARDSVYVLSAKDGREVFRKFLPRYSRSPVAFLNKNRFVFTEPASGVRVFQTPD